MAKKPKSSAAARSPHLIVSEPISVLERDLKADAGGLFKALGKSILHIGTGKFWELASDASEAAAALGLKADPGGLTWYLIRRSLQKAMLSLVDEAWLHRMEDAPPPSDALGGSPRQRDQQSQTRSQRDLLPSASQSAFRGALGGMVS